MLKEEFLRLLREDLAFREEVRRQVLTDDLLELPARVERLRAEMHEEFRRVWEAIRENSRQIAALTERMDRVEAQIAENSRQIAALTERMDRAEAQLQANSRQIEALTKQVQENSRQIAILTEQVQENYRQIAILTEQVQENSRQIASLTAVVGSLQRDVGDLKGRSLEAEWSRKAPAYLGRWFRRLKVLQPEALRAILDEAEDEGLLSREEVVEVLQADVVAEGFGDDRTPVRVLVEVSYVIDSHDVRRARQRADLLARLGVPVVAIVAGVSASDAVQAEAQKFDVWVIEDGRRTVGS